MATATPASLDFGDVGVGTSEQLTLNIQATPDPAASSPAFFGTGSSLFSGRTVATANLAAPFSASITMPCDPATGMAVIVVTCSPTAEGTFNASLEVTVNGGAGGAVSVTVSLSATAVSATAVSDPTQSAFLKVPDFGSTNFVNRSNAKNAWYLAAEADVQATWVDPKDVDKDNPVSYLLLGAFDYSTESPAAKELLKVMVNANASHDPRDGDGATTMGGTGYTETVTDGTTAAGALEMDGLVFVDDVRKRAQDVGLSRDADPDNQLTMTARQKESENLYRRGGWRDHSDGNRLSTTWGDKVEVVRGNYKMVVLGRQNNPAEGMGWEASGGHIQDFAPGTMPGASMWLEWIPDANFNATGHEGAWLLVNTTENVYQFARTAGNLRNEVWGDVHESYTGSETPPLSNATVATDDTHGTGGHAVDEDIKIAGINYLGMTPPDASDNNGKVRSNPHLIEKKWARQIDSWTGTAACPIPKITEKTFVGKVDDNGSANSEQTIFGVKKEVSTIYGASLGFTQVIGMFLKTTNAIIHISQEASLCLDIYIGAKIEIDLSAKVTVGTKLTAEFEIEKFHIHAKKDEVALAKTELAAKITKVVQDVTDIGAKHTTLALDVKHLTTSYTRIAANFKTLAGEVTTIAGKVDML